MHEGIGELESLRARHAAEMAEMAAQQTLAEQLAGAHGLPLPKRIMFAKGLEPWLIYERRPRAAAAELLHKWEPFIAPNVHAVADGCLYISPELHKGGALRWALTAPVALDFINGEGFGSVELFLFAFIDGQRVRVKVELQSGTAYGHSTDWPHPKPHAYAERDHLGRQTGRMLRQTPNLGESQRVEWGSGGDSSCHVTYFYALDNRSALLSMLGD